MDNLPFGQLPIDPKNSPSYFQKITASSAFQALKRLNDVVYLFAKQSRKVQIEQIQATFKPSTKHYGTAIFLDLLILVVAINFGLKPASQLIAPWVGSLQPGQTSQIQLPQAHFAFVPGSSSSKMAKVRLDGLSTLAFFDIPVNSDGTLNLETTGYINFKSEQASNLFAKAHNKGVKVVVTLSQVDNIEISQILSDPEAQQNVITQAIKEVKDSRVNGVNIDFEYSGTVPWGAKGKYSQFVQNFAAQMHQQIPGSLVAVSVPNSANNDFYDLKSISQASDQVLMMAYTIAVPETKNASVIIPVFDGAQDYWPRLSATINSLFYQLPKDKFVMETAWYGNGDNYPLYTPKDVPVADGGSAENIGNTLQTPLSTEITASLISEVPAGSRESVRKNLPYIAKALEGEGILNQNVLAYALATIEHETAGTFEPIEEIKGRKSARRLGYEGGTDYFGRGFIQLTHLRNYKNIGQRIGLGDQLVKNPDLASKPDVAAKVLAAFFKDNNVANLASSGNFVAARNPVNPDYWGYSIARSAYRYLYAIG